MCVIYLRKLIYFQTEIRWDKPATLLTLVYTGLKIITHEVMSHMHLQQQQLIRIRINNLWTQDLEGQR